jgi:hypothetical protein
MGAGKARGGLAVRPISSEWTPAARLDYVSLTTNGALDESALKAAGVEAIVRLPHRVVHLLTGLNADQYAAEIRGQLASRDLS